MNDGAVIAGLIVAYTAGLLLGWWSSAPKRKTKMAIFYRVPLSDSEARELEEALDGLANRGNITREQAAEAKRRIRGEGGEA